jgi:Protein of unknown function (DUF1761)
MEFNFIALFVGALVTLLIGMIWYSEKVFGNVWMREAGLHKEDLQKGSMLKIFGFTYLFSVMIMTVVQALVIHQGGAIAMVGGPGELTKAVPSYSAFMSDYGTAFRTFKHGALHGFATGLFFAFPMIAINGLFERKSWKYIFIHSGYWMLTLIIMGAIICGWPK